MSDPDIARAVATVPVLAGQPIDSWQIRRLPSLTNRVFRLTGEGGDFVLRLANEAPYLDRAREAHNHRLAAGLGLAPPLLHDDPATGVVVTAFLPDSVPFHRFRDRTAALRAVARSLRQLHQSGVEFQGAMHLAPTMGHYLAIAGEAGRDVAAVWNEWRPRVLPLLALLERSPVPSHVDPVPDNILIRDGADGPVALFVDWEYSAPAASAWDLADLAIEAGLDASDTATLLDAYGRHPDPSLAPAVALYRPLLDLLAAAWAASQTRLPGRLEAHRSLIAERLLRAQAVLDGPDFSRTVERAREACATS